MIALFDEPPRISVKSDLGVGRNGLLMGMAVDGSNLSGIVVLENGDITLLSAGYFTVDYRYDVSKNAWIDTNTPETDQ